MYYFLGIDTHQFYVILSFDENPVMYNNNNNNNIYFTLVVDTRVLLQFLQCHPWLDKRRLTDKALSLSEYSSVTNHSLD